MDRLWATKNEFDPFRSVIPGLGTVGFLPIFRCTFYRCPYCRWAFKAAWGHVNSLLGKGERACWYCKQTFWDGSSEWPEMNSKERGQFLFPITICGFLGAFLLIFGLSFGLGNLRGARFDFDSILVLALFVPPLSIWLCFRAWQIRPSIRRYNERGKHGIA
jgi:hypothetical protein